MRVIFGLQLALQNGVLVYVVTMRACWWVGLKCVFITMMFAWCMHVDTMRAWLIKIAIKHALLWVTTILAHLEEAPSMAERSEETVPGIPFILILLEEISWHSMNFWTSGGHAKG